MGISFIYVAGPVSESLVYNNLIPSTTDAALTADALGDDTWGW